MNLDWIAVSLTEPFTLYIVGHDVHGARDGENDDDEPEDGRRRKLSLAFFASNVEAPPVKTCRFAKFGEKFRNDFFTRLLFDRFFRFHFVEF